MVFGKVNLLIRKCVITRTKTSPEIAGVTQSLLLCHNHPKKIKDPECIMASYEKICKTFVITYMQSSSFHIFSPQK